MRERLTPPRRASALAIPLAAILAWPQTAQASKAEAVGSVRTVYFQVPKTPTWMGNEISPDVTSSRKDVNSYYVTTDSTYKCDFRGSLITRSVIYCGLHDTELLSKADASLLSPGKMPKGYDHQRNYSGVFSANTVVGANEKKYIVMANHGENKNEARPSYLGPENPIQTYYYQNSVTKKIETGPDGCNSGFYPGGYRDCWESYNGFVSSSYFSIAALTKLKRQARARIKEEQVAGSAQSIIVDNGPSVWPKYGYTDSRGNRTSNGVRHPYAILANPEKKKKGQKYDPYKYEYLFVLDTGKTDGTTPNLDMGIRVSRTLAKKLGKGFKTYTRKGWRTALPKGVTAKNSKAGFAKRSPAQSEPLFSSTTSTFSVAKIEKRQEWIGVEQGPDMKEKCGNGDRVWKTHLRTSKDLTHWSKPVEVKGIDNGCGFTGSRLGYPRLYNADGTTKEVSLRNFYIGGTGGGTGTVNIQRVRVSK